VVTVSPHRREGESVTLVMWTVALFLVPAGLVGLWAFGWRAAWVTALAVASCVATEATVQRLRGVRIRIGDGSAVITGVLLAFVLPASVSWYVPVIGGVVAIGIAKQAFGGLGANFFNPALVARAFLQFAFARQVSLSSWPYVSPDVHGIRRVLVDLTADAMTSATPVTGATPLALLKWNPGVAWSAIEGAPAFGPPIVWMLPRGPAIAAFGLLVAAAAGGVVYLAAHAGRKGRLWAVVGVGALLLLGVVPTGDVSMGRIAGCIGETSAWALILGGLALIYFRCIRWELPAAYIATAAVLLMVLPVSTEAGLATGFAAPERALAHVFGGGLMLGAFFMITDMVTSPMTVRGQVVFGVLAGALVALIRLYGGFPEGVCYSILLANAARPLIDRYTRPRVFGARGPEPAATG
jgi:electron transport complex protein RnfD